MASPLPKFEHPPLSEVILGVQFEPDPKLLPGRLGGLLRKLAPDWDEIESTSELGQTREPVSSEPEWIPTGLNIQRMFGSGVRLRARSRDRSRIVQLENGWLVYNWNAQPDADYPGYERVRPEFERAIEQLSRALVEETARPLSVNLWEVGYVNVIPRGELWNTPGDWTAIFPKLLVRSDGSSAGDLQTFSGRWALVPLPGRVRLQIFLEHALMDPSKPAGDLTLRLVARGPCKDYGTLLGGIDLGHETIVKTFAELCSDHARSYWGYQS